MKTENAELRVIYSEKESKMSIKKRKNRERERERHKVTDDTSCNNKPSRRGE